MITRLITNRIGLFLFSNAAPKMVNGVAMADLPHIEYPTKPKPKEDQRLSMNVIYQTLDYVRKDKMPNCRYFAVQHKNRIYRFYNAYYYPMGRMINRVASQIRGRNSPHYKNHQVNIKNGDVCVIVNIEDPLVTGKKLLFKKFRYHTGFVGHLKEYTYRHVLNTKPELLYHFLLRRVMPKNKLSMKYLQNLVLCRGPTHNLKHFPEFAPDRKTYSVLPKVNLLDMLKQDESVKLIEQSQEGSAQKILNRNIERVYDDHEIQQMRRESDQVVEDLSQIHENAPEYKTSAVLSKRQYQVKKRREKVLEARYKPVRAPYKKKKNDFDEKLKVFTSEKKARKSPHYELLKNEDLQQIDDENVVESPLKVGDHDEVDDEVDE